MSAAVVAAAPATAAVDFYFPGDADQVSAAMANLCVARSAIVAEQDKYHVLCTRTVSGMKGVLAQMLIGNSYSTTPELKMRFAIISAPMGIKVQAVQWLETQMAFGQTRRQELEGKASADLAQALRSAGGTDLPPNPTPAPVNAPPTGPDLCSDHPDLGMCQKRK